MITSPIGFPFKITEVSPNLLWKKKNDRLILVYPRLNINIWKFGFSHFILEFSFIRIKFLNSKILYVNIYTYVYNMLED